jgi:hypothetical protein
MQLDKSVILDLLHSRGAPDKAEIADASLPATVDTDTHAGLLEKFGLTPAELLEHAAGGKAGTTLGGLLGR